MLANFLSVVVGMLKFTTITMDLSIFFYFTSFYSTHFVALLCIHIQGCYVFFLDIPSYHLMMYISVSGKFFALKFFYLILMLFLFYLINVCIRHRYNVYELHVIHICVYKYIYNIFIYVYMCTYM